MPVREPWGRCGPLWPRDHPRALPRLSSGAPARGRLDQAMGRVIQSRACQFIPTAEVPQPPDGRAERRSR